MSCELCRLEKITNWFYEDDICAFLICKTCRIPMMVLKRHTMNPTEKEINHIQDMKDRLFPDYKWRKNQRKIPDHLHWHLERK